MKKLSIEFMREEKDEPVIDCRMLANEYLELCDFHEELKMFTGKTKEDVISYGNKRVDGWIKDGNFDHYSEYLSSEQMEELGKYIRKGYIDSITSAWGFDQKVPVSERAIFQRIQRKLAKEDQKLMKSRGSRALSNLGSYYIVDLRTNFVKDYHIENLEELAKEVNAIASHECVESEK